MPAEIKNTFDKLGIPEAERKFLAGVGAQYESEVVYHSLREDLQKKGVKFDRRVEHGMTHSLYIHDPNGYGVEFVYDLPREVWQDDIEGALNYVKTLPTEGPEALEDRVEGVPHFRQPAPAK